jgi:uncharacterized protein
VAATGSMSAPIGAILALSMLSAFALAAPPRVAAAQPAKPSFDCAKARTQDEITICSDARLAELDQAVAIGVKEIPAIYQEAARSIARQTLAARRSCGADKLCILDQQAAAITRLDDFGAQVPVPPWVGSYRLVLFRARVEPPANGLPGRVGQCTLTKIASISTRFGEELKPPTDKLPSSGSAVSYANKGFQVSYGFVGAIAASRIGDEVLLCLVLLPKNCPPGDDRGKVYAATNVRTKGSWVLPDATHLCGGA